MPAKFKVGSVLFRIGFPAPCQAGPQRPFQGRRPPKQRVQRTEDALIARRWGCGEPDGALPLHQKHPLWCICAGRVGLRRGTLSIGLHSCVELAVMSVPEGFGASRQAIHS